MARFYPSTPGISRVQHDSTNFVLRSKESVKESILYTMLPSALQNHLPRLPSIRRLVGLLGFAASRQPSETDPRPSSGARTPEEQYRSTMVLSGSGTAMAEDTASYIIESASEDDTSRPSTSERRRAVGMELTESSSGIAWKFANQG